MKIIDSHMHFSNIASFKHCAEYDSIVDYSYNGYINESKNANIVYSICMGVTETDTSLFPSDNTQTPMFADLDERIPDGMYLCPGINPHTINDEAIGRLEKLIKSSKKIAGIKIYAGYYHIDIYDKIFEPVYCLADEYGLPVAIHSGDTYSDRGLLTYSHPLHVDRVAVRHRDLKLVICHMGNPWILDACELAFKNKNVYVDMSGIFCGNEEYLNKMSNTVSQTDRLIQALEYLNNYEKVLFGTDWPLATMESYLNFCLKLIPAEEQENVFYNNALKVFDRIKQI